MKNVMKKLFLPKAKVDWSGKTGYTDNKCNLLFIENEGEPNLAKATRMTRQKKIILDIVRDTHSHPSADWIYEQAKKLLPDISLGTVYRNLNVLRDAGEILELNYGSTFSRYDGIADNHYHFYCEECQQLFDVTIPVYQGLDRMVHDMTGFEVRYHRMEFYGLCSNCQKAEADRTVAR